MNLSVIVPTLNEAREVSGCLRSLKREHAGEILVVDGGSSDGTPAEARASGARVLESSAGLAAQCNAGVGHASGDRLFFVSADSRPGAGWRDAIDAALRSAYVVGGGFRLELDDPALIFRLLAWGGNFRSRYAKLALGDQGLFVRRSAFEAVCGMDPASLIPYARLCRDLRRHGEFALLPQPMLSSAREWRERGLVRTTVRHLLTDLRSGAEIWS